VNDAPHAPWVLSGESMGGPARLRGAHVTLPTGLQRLPGPAMIGAARYADSPVGPYHELAVGIPARLGARPGLCITTMVVDSADSRVGGRRNWGFPMELGTLVWEADGDERELRWVERGIVVRGRPSGPVLPVLLPVRNVQRRSDSAVMVPARLRGRGRLARLEVEVGENDPLVWLAGRHRGLLVSGVRFVLDPARVPSGVRSTLKAPLQAPEPALTAERPLVG
jgi:acetoacetate decarboxylase